MKKLIEKRQRKKASINIKIYKLSMYCFCEYNYVQHVLKIIIKITVVI